MIKVHYATSVEVSEEVVLFAFDDRSIPFKLDLFLTLKQAEKYPGNPVLRRGENGTPDAFAPLFYGSVIHIDGKFRMWYNAIPKYPHPRFLAYAESDDGVHWVKPNLGLVEFNGSRDNNLCLLEPRDSPFAHTDDYICVMHDPEDPNPEKRFKMVYIVFVDPKILRCPPDSLWKGGPTMFTACSPDGLRWRLVGDKPPIEETLEVGGLYKFGGVYYAIGQQVYPWVTLPNGKNTGRAIVSFRSKDFVHWSQAKALAFVRPISAGEEAHLGAGIWNRGNVLIGLYGMWHGIPLRDPLQGKEITMDLGFIINNDGIYFREPIPDFPMIARGCESEWDAGSLMQGHAFANIGDKTYIWYGAPWYDPKLRDQGYMHGQVGLATLRRDGFGYLSPRYENGHLLTCPLSLCGGKAKLYVNVEGLSERSLLKIELLDEEGKPLNGYSGDASVPITKPGLREQVRWRGRDVISGLKDEPFMIKVDFQGTGEEKPKLYALYLTTHFGN